MVKRYNKHSSSFRLKVALEAIKEKKTTAELIQEFGITSSQLFAWNKQLIDEGTKVFEEKKKNEKKHKDEIARLQRVIGKQTAEIDFLEDVLNR